MGSHALEATAIEIDGQEKGEETKETNKMERLDGEPSANRKAFQGRGKTHGIHEARNYHGHAVGPTKGALPKEPITHLIGKGIKVGPKETTEDDGCGLKGKRAATDERRPS